MPTGEHIHDANTYNMSYDLCVYEYFSTRNLLRTPSDSELADHSGVLIYGDQGE